jgi:hypothetical protein
LLTRNQYANGALAVAMGVHLFAVKAHTDTKRILCRIGLSISDTSARRALESMASNALSTLQRSVASSDDLWCVVIDNCQEYCLVQEPSMGMKSTLKQGTAASAIKLEDCPLGAFNLADYFGRLLQMERKKLTTAALWKDINHTSISMTVCLHWLRILIFYIPELEGYKSDLTRAFEEPPICSRRIDSQRKTVVQPLGTNGERKVEIHGMEKALRDFDQQMMITEQSVEHDQKLWWYRGDGATHATITKLQRSHCTIPHDYESH